MNIVFVWSIKENFYLFNDEQSCVVLCFSYIFVDV